MKPADLVDTSSLADLLDVKRVDIWNWRRRGKLPEPVAVLNGGPVWTKQQFPKKVRDELRKGR